MSEQIQTQNLEQGKSEPNKQLNIIEEMLTAKGVSFNKPKGEVANTIDSCSREDYKIKLSQMQKEELIKIESLKTKINNNNNNDDLVN